MAKSVKLKESQTNQQVWVKRTKVNVETLLQRLILSYVKPTKQLYEYDKYPYTLP